MNIPFYVSSDAGQHFEWKKLICTISFPKLKKIQNNFHKTIPCSIQICAQIPLLEVAVPKFMHMPFNISVAALDHLIQYKKRLEFYLLTQSVNRQNERDNIRCKKFFSKNETLLPLYAVKKIFKHFNNIYQLSTACYCSLY